MTSSTTSSVNPCSGYRYGVANAFVRTDCALFVDLFTEETTTAFVVVCIIVAVVEDILINKNELVGVSSL